MATNKKYQVTFEVECEDISYTNLDVINSTTSEVLDAKVKNIIEIE